MLGLHVAGIDLRRTDDGRWVCFEVNPSPGFTFYQEETGQPIAEAIARLLAAGRSPPVEVGERQRLPQRVFSTVSSSIT